MLANFLNRSDSAGSIIEPLEKILDRLRPDSPLALLALDLRRSSE
jgi:hypothetical protein